MQCCLPHDPAMHLSCTSLQCSFTQADKSCTKLMRSRPAFQLQQASLLRLFWVLDSLFQSSAVSTGTGLKFCSVAAQMVLIMDEVDGMSAGDRGGVADLIQTLKGAKLPIICICNDKYNQKLKSLRNHCLELDYRSASIPACLAKGEVATCMPGSQAAAYMGTLLMVLPPHSLS